MELITMTCRNCGGKLQINKDVDQILCQNCSTEYLVSINDGGISLKLLSEGLKKIAVSSDKTASELALARLEKEKDQLIHDFGKISESLVTASGISLINNKYQDVRMGERIFNPTRYIVKCRELLAHEKKVIKIFRNDEYIRDLETILNALIKLEKRNLEIIEQVKFHTANVKKL